MKKCDLVSGMKVLTALIVLICSSMVYAQTTTTFTGIGNWSDNGNWDNGVPIASSTAIIGSGSLTIDGNYECNNLTINSGASLTISAGNSLIVSGTLLNSAGVNGLVIESDTTGSGQLLNNTPGVLATVKQLLIKDQWHYIGIPITYLPNVTSVFNNCYVLWIHENDAWANGDTGWQSLTSDDPLIKLHGYAVQHNDSQDRTITFQGKLNTGIVDTIFNSALYGFNFISNPYTASIDWSLYSSVSSFDDYTNPINGMNMNNAFYVWKPELGAYGSYINGSSTNGQSQYIPPTQGFFVQVTNVSSSISFTDDCKVVQSTERFSSYNPANNDMNTDIVRLTVSDDHQRYDETVIYAKSTATDHFDQDADAVKLKAVETDLPQIYSVMNGREYSINAIRELDEQTIIPIRVLVKSNMLQTLSLNARETSINSRSLYLYDKSGNMLVDMNTESYEFKGIAGETCSFYLSFSKINSERIARLHKTVEQDLSNYSYVTVRPLQQGVFEVQQDKSISK